MSYILRQEYAMYVMNMQKKLNFYFRFFQELTLLTRRETVKMMDTLFALSSNDKSVETLFCEKYNRHISTCSAYTNCIILENNCYVYKTIE